MANKFTDIKMVFGFDLESLYNSVYIKKVLSKIKKAIKASGGDPSEYIHYAINSVGNKSYAVGQDVCTDIHDTEYSILSPALTGSDMNSVTFLENLEKVIGTDLYQEMVEYSNNDDDKPSLLTLMSSVKGKKIRKARKAGL